MINKPRTTAIQLLNSSQQQIFMLHWSSSKHVFFFSHVIFRLFHIKNLLMLNSCRETEPKYHSNNSWVRYIMMDFIYVKFLHRNNNYVRMWNTFTPISGLVHNYARYCVWCSGDTPESLNTYLPVSSILSRRWIGLHVKAGDLSTKIGLKDCVCWDRWDQEKKLRSWMNIYPK